MEDLKRDLAALLARYPQLQNSRLLFSANDFQLLPDNNAPDAPSSISDVEIPPCEQRLPGPDIIPGPCGKIEVRASPVHGYGVFAKEAIAEGELVERSKMLRLGLRSNMSDDKVLTDYAWSIQKCQCQKCLQYGNARFIALGFGSIYNHAEQPNTRTKMDPRREIITIKAARQIEKDEEIFVSYGGKYFLVRDIQKLITENGEWRDAMTKMQEKNLP